MTSDERTQEQAVASLLAPVMPKSPWEQAEEKYGAGEAVLRRLGNLFTGGLLDEQIIPEYSTNSHAAYKQAVKDYGTQMAAFQGAQMLQGLTRLRLLQLMPSWLTSSEGLRSATTTLTCWWLTRTPKAETPLWQSTSDTRLYQWSQLSPESKRDLRDRYASESGAENPFGYRLEAEGKSPEQVQATKQSETFGSQLGTQYGEDRSTIRGVRGQVMKADQTLQSLDSVMDLLQSPDNDDLTGIERRIRDIFWANRKDDGTVDAIVAQGVVELIQQATFGALSQSELDLLKGGISDANKSVEYNIGTLNQAKKRVENDRARFIDAGKTAADRYSKWDGQDDYDSLMSDDWNYLNIGEGSQIKPIVFMQDGEEKTVTFNDYYNARIEQAGPYENLTREQIVIDYRKAREAEKELWEKQQEVQRQLQEEARQALELEFQE